MSSRGVGGIMETEDLRASLQKVLDKLSLTSKWNISRSEDAALTKRRSPSPPSSPPSSPPPPLPLPPPPLQPLPSAHSASGWRPPPSPTTTDEHSSRESLASTYENLPTSTERSRLPSLERANWDWAWPWAASEAAALSAVEAAVEESRRTALLAGPGVYLQGVSMPNSPARSLSEWQRRAQAEEKQQQLQREAEENVVKMLQAATETLRRFDLNSKEKREVREALRRLRLIPSKSFHRLFELDEKDELEDGDTNSQSSSSSKDIPVSELKPRDDVHYARKARKTLRDIDRALDRARVRERALQTGAFAQAAEEAKTKSVAEAGAAPEGAHMSLVALTEARSGRRKSRAAPVPDTPLRNTRIMRRRRHSSRMAERAALAVLHSVRARAELLKEAVSKETLPPERLSYSYVMRKLRPLAPDVVPSEDESRPATPAAEPPPIAWQGADADVTMEAPDPSAGVSGGRRAPARPREADAEEGEASRASSISGSLRSGQGRHAGRPAHHQRSRWQPPPAYSSSSSATPSRASVAPARTGGRGPPPNPDSSHAAKAATAAMKQGPLSAQWSVPFFTRPPSTVRRMELVQRRLPQR